MIIGILLAAGNSRRFGPQNKLLQKLPDGTMMALSSATNLMEALPLSLGVIRQGNTELESAFAELGMASHPCEYDEMAASLAAGIRHSRLIYPAASGFVITLADMPYILPETIVAVAEKLADEGGIVVPTYHGRKGHPVGFSASFYDELLGLRGDKGARELLDKYSSEVKLIECDDPGILVDIDTPDDLLAKGLAQPPGPK